MDYYANYVRDTLFNEIAEMERNLDDFVKKPGHDFTRSGKMSFSDMLKFYISAGGECP